jgi:hypothetical protein
MTKDGDILEELVKINHGYKFCDVKIYSLPTIHYEKVNYNKFMVIRRLTKKLKCNAILRAEGNLDVINLIDHHKQYKVSLKKAFEVCEENNLSVGCSITFRRQK